jgi:hypothetical protein
MPLVGVMTCILSSAKLFYRRFLAQSRPQWPLGLRHALSRTRPDIGVVSSNALGGTDVCMRLFYVWAVPRVGRDHATV